MVEMETTLKNMIEAEMSMHRKVRDLANALDDTGKARTGATESE
jgi:hypothetical protein